MSDGKYGFGKCEFCDEDAVVLVDETPACLPHYEKKLKDVREKVDLVKTMLEERDEHEEGNT